MFDSPSTSFIAKLNPHFPIRELVIGKSRSEVAELLPRLFNLCRTAQSLAVCAALDLPSTESIDTLTQEIIRDHVLRLAIILPRHLGLSPLHLPVGWQLNDTFLRQLLFGPPGRLPETIFDFENFLKSDYGIAGLLSKIAVFFSPGEGVSSALPFVSVETASNPSSIVDNSCAQRVIDHPVIAHMAARSAQSRSLFWRLVARSYDLDALLNNVPLTVTTPHPGCVHVPATRGLYTINAQHADDKITHFTRVTPTDHLCIQGGVLDQVLTTILPERALVLPIVLDILDPCGPLCVEKITNA
ncbi:MAG: hypothetical protein HRT83_01900 [Hyphomicrobiaceae bacterium]|nr:hypothetical protein [Hyphomicrobiaceae bacterium]